MIKQKYETLDRKNVSVANLKSEEKIFLAEIYRQYEGGANYLSFKNLYSDPDSMVYRSAKRRGKTVEESPLYQVCEDLSNRLGVRQGYLVKEEIMPYQRALGAERKEMTTGQVAKLAGCSVQAVRKAIFSWRLRARKVGRLALIWDEDARAFAQSVRHRRPAQKRRSKELARA